MKGRRFVFMVVAFLMGMSTLFAQAHGVSERYVKPEDTAVIQKVEKWQDLKFGLMMHWGPHSQWGVVESWSICPEDEDWTQRDPKHGETYFEYVKNYENLQLSFNPLNFDPDKWALAAKKAGMKYLVFTTKHHDGFAMYDTAESDYKITDEKTPFSTNTKADVTQEIFKSFRNKDFMIGAYFSKPDWHSNYYWWDYFPPLDRNVNYSVEAYPDRWDKFKEFTFNQLNEITSNYGSVDILWLDGGQVSPRNNQDINMDQIGKMARENQPGILIVDRIVSGKWENYVTPEQTIPDEALQVPWESVISMGDSFSYVPGDTYKSPQKIIYSLIEIVAKGGNYLLNIAPGPTGDFDQVAYDRLMAIAEWMEVNGTAIYSTRTLDPVQQGNIFYNKHKDGKTINVFHTSGTAKEYKAPKQIAFDLPKGIKAKGLKALGIDAEITWSQKGNKIILELPENRDNLKYATVVQIER